MRSKAIIFPFLVVVVVALTSTSSSWAQGRYGRHYRVHGPANTHYRWSAPTSTQPSTTTSTIRSTTSTAKPTTSTAKPTTSTVRLATTTTTTPVKSTTTTSVASSVPIPNGPTGSWSVAFDDEFNGTALDQTKWSTLDGTTMNNVTVAAQNVSVNGGQLGLTLKSSSSGAEVATRPSNGQGFGLPVGGYAEARVYFPGTATSLYNWGGFWTSGTVWPQDGENDIAEVLGGQLTVNYHSSSGAHNQGAVSGYTGNAFHTYGLLRLANKSEVYWDGKLVKSYATDDNQAPQSLILNVGSGGVAAYGAAGQLKVDYVRAWLPKA